MTLERDSCIKVCEVAHADHTFAGTAGRLGLYAALDMLLAPSVATNPTRPDRAARPSATACP